jgi:hypothetical protein
MNRAYSGGAAMTRLMAVTVMLGSLGTMFYVSQCHGRSAEDESKIVPPAVLSEVNQDYVQSVRPIFAKKCFDCHSQNTHWPWYASLPGVGFLIAKDVREARDDMDMSNDFPFVGKGSPSEYLSVIEDALNDGSMPPFRYRILHSESALTEPEKKTIHLWIDKSLERIGDH